MNTLAALSLLETYLRATQELSALIQKAHSENRDISDDEIKGLKLTNDTMSEQLIQRLSK